MPKGSVQTQYIRPIACPEEILRIQRRNEHTLGTQAPRSPATTKTEVPPKSNGADTITRVPVGEGGGQVVGTSQESKQEGSGNVGSAGDGGARNDTSTPAAYSGGFDVGDFSVGGDCCGGCVGGGDGGMEVEHKD